MSAIDRITTMLLCAFAGWHLRGHVAEHGWRPLLKTAPFALTSIAAVMWLPAIILHRAGHTTLSAVAAGLLYLPAVFVGSRAEAMWDRWRRPWEDQ